MSKPRIMLVEDERVVAADIAECVTGLGYEVVGAAASGTEAIRMAFRTRPDLVLMDIKLKGILDGIEVAAELYDQLKIPVVYLTAHADAEILERAKQTAPSGYVLKPFDERALRTAIEMAFDRHLRERRLIEEGQRLATAIGSIDEAVIVTQENGQIAVMNRVAETLTGWKQEEALGRPVGEIVVLLDGRSGAPLSSHVGRVIREGIGIGLGEQPVLLNRSGIRTAIQGTATPVRDGASDAVGVCLLFRGSAQRAAEEPCAAPDRCASSRMEILGCLTASVAQKFTSLLAASRGRARAGRLANRLLEFGQRQPGPPHNLDLNDLIGGLDDLLQCALGDRIRLDLHLAPGALLAHADPGQIELLLMHLAISARESACDGQFSVKTSAGESGPVIALTAPRGAYNAALGFSALDEIARRPPGEVRFSTEDGTVQIFLPAPGC